MKYRHRVCSCAGQVDLASLSQAPAVSRLHCPQLHNQIFWASIQTHRYPAISAQVVDLFRPVDNSQGPPYEIGYGENQWPETPGSFRQVSEKYIDAVLSLAMEVVKAISIGLILGYKAAPKTENEAVSGIGNHTDFGILTFLLTDSQKDSLQVLSKTGEWVPADPIPGCYVVICGESWRHAVEMDQRSLRLNKIPSYPQLARTSNINPALLRSKHGCFDIAAPSLGWQQSRR
ncbi:hypothetical protein BKA61DRAFT_658553 [Leptodontidium sp. MPI-SDFR-AT-0119]|nr:hypothetical protein BKA61DRAFT_658553 [Leptodontidium sp. MPI-SDFR-AT-0119]